MSQQHQKVQEAKTSQIRQRVRALQKQGKDIINLAAGELIDTLSPEMKEAAIQAINNNCNLYTDTSGIPELRELIADNAPILSDHHYTAEQVVITGGAKLGLYETMITLLSPGDEVIIPAPFWSTFSAQVKLVGAKVKVIETKHNHFDVNSQEIADAITPDTRMIILNIPSNPTGRIWPDSEIKRITELAIDHNLWIVWDACYAEIIFDNNVIPSPLRVNPAAKDNTIVIGSFSKSYAIAGWRLGYLAAPSNIAKSIGALQSRISSNANAVAQQTLINVLSQSQPIPDKITKHVQNNRDIALPQLNQLPLLKPVTPHGGFYIFCDINPEEYSIKRSKHIDDIDDVVLDMIENAGVAVTPGSAFNSKTGVRMALSVPTSELQEGLSRLERLLS